MKKIIFILLISILGHAAVAAAYPVKYENTGEVKDMQRANAVTIIEDLQTAIDNKETYFKIPAGEYRFNNSLVGAFVVKNAENITIDCSDSMFYSEKPEHAVLISNCKNVTLKNLKIDYDPLPYLQGVIKSVDYENQNLTVEFDEGYPLPDESWIKNAGGMMKFIYFSPDGSRMMSSNSNFDSPWLDWVGTYSESEPSIRNVSGRTYEIKLLRGYIFDKKSPVGVGSKVAIPWRRNRGVFLFGCSNVTMENIDIYAFPGYGINEVYGDGGNIYRNICITRLPGTDRLLSGNADAFHSSCMVKGPVIENCSWQFVGDDFINIRGYYSIVTEVGDDYLKIASPYPFASFGDNRTFRVGDKMEFYEYTSSEFKKLDSISITEIEDLSANETISPSQLASDFKADTGAGIREGISMRVFKVKFDASLSKIKKYAVCFSRNCVGQGAVIRNNVFHDNLSRAVVMRGDNALIYNNTFSRNGMSSILIQGEAAALEAGLPQNITIKGNQIYSPNYLGGGYDQFQCSAINANLKQAQSADNTTLGKNIDISDNYIFDCGASAVVLNLYGDSAVFNNRIFSTNCKSLNFNKPFIFENSAAAVGNNLFNREETDDSVMKKNNFAQLSFDDIEGYINAADAVFYDDKVRYAVYALNRGSQDFICEIAVINSDGMITASYVLENYAQPFGLAGLVNGHKINPGEQIRIRAYNNGKITQEYMFEKQ